MKNRWKLGATVALGVVMGSSAGWLAKPALVSAADHVDFPFVDSLVQSGRVEVPEGMDPDVLAALTVQDGEDLTDRVVEQ